MPHPRHEPLPRLSARPPERRSGRKRKNPGGPVLLFPTGREQEYRAAGNRNPDGREQDSQASGCERGLPPSCRLFRRRSSGQVLTGPFRKSRIVLSML
ncbi:hypothetical protein HMPREF9141_2241 [Prevotella multiformis DSM 16608]|uniref:Uncharacterized protein n=1 Tax=Prevotella multiformis DSM 16608 TaxID=888743 RepID=F0F9H4_9BACT|nr:hypothetical protein HMPREF9141_2241 [Prevotella multiformis DSM 16608]